MTRFQELLLNVSLFLSMVTLIKARIRSINVKIHHRRPLVDKSAMKTAKCRADKPIHNLSHVNKHA